MVKKITLTLLLMGLSLPLSAQQLYMPRNVKAAYQNDTRSFDGKPGKNYWQNKSAHNIRISVAPPNRRVTGSEDITYQNNSPVALPVLVFRFELNFHAPEAQREIPIETEQLTGDVVIDEYSESGKVKAWQPLLQYKGITYNAVKLNQPLAPGASINLSFKWHYDLARKSSREGAIDPTTFFIAYFYPRVAVFDDVSAWDTTNFTVGHEFYNDFNDYALEVTVPKNFVVWATGDLQNPDEVLQPKYAERLRRSLTGDEIINVASLAELKATSVTKQSDMLTWKWKAANVTDVALAISDHYIWDAGSVVVDRKTGRRASVQAAYDEPSKDFTKMVEYGKHTLDWSSNNYPGVPYPFSKTTIVRGFADMEYPMMANDSSNADPDQTRFIAEHELYHSWFPFYMGINERRYSFMDEGWTTAFEYLISVNDLGKAKAGENFKKFRVQDWITSTKPDADLPIITPGDALVGDGFGNNEYGKAALGYLALKDLLGDAEFKRVLGEFINRWNGKHTLPWDMFFSFSDISGKDLNWFFDNWFFSNGYIDLAVKQVTLNGGNAEVMIQNVGGFAAPVDIIVTYADGTSETLHQTPAIWRTNPKETKVVVSARKPIKTLALDGGIFMDAKPGDNQWEEK